MGHHDAVLAPRFRRSRGRAVAIEDLEIASAVEFVEATTTILAVGVTRGWRAPLYGTIAALGTLAVIIGALGVTIVTIVPGHALKAFVGRATLGLTRRCLIMRPINLADTTKKLCPSAQTLFVNPPVSPAPDAAMPVRAGAAHRSEVGVARCHTDPPEAILPKFVHVA